MCEYIILIRTRTIPFCAKSLLSGLTALAVAGDEEVGQAELGHPPTPRCQHGHIIFPCLCRFLFSSLPLLLFYLHHLLLVFGVWRLVGVHRQGTCHSTGYNYGTKMMPMCVLTPGVVGHILFSLPSLHIGHFLFHHKHRRARFLFRQARENNQSCSCRCGTSTPFTTCHFPPP